MFKRIDMLDEFKRRLMLLGHVWGLSPLDIEVFVRIYEEQGVMGYTAVDGECYERLLDAGWIRVVNEIDTFDEVGEGIIRGRVMKKWKKSVTLVYKCNGLGVIVEGYMREMGEFLDVMGENMASLLDIGGYERDCKVASKNDVYKWVTKRQRKLEDVVNAEGLTLGKYIP